MKDDLLKAVDSAVKAAPKSSAELIDSMTSLLSKRGAANGRNKEVSRDGSRVAVIVTDGRASDYPGTVEAANRAKDNGVSLYGVGLGTRVNLDEIKGLVSIGQEGGDSQQQNHFAVGHHSKSRAVARALAQRLCAARP